MQFERSAAQRHLLVHRLAGRPVQKFRFRAFGPDLERQRFLQVDEHLRDRLEPPQMRSILGAEGWPQLYDFACIFEADDNLGRRASAGQRDPAVKTV